MHKYLNAIGFGSWSKKDFDEWLYEEALADPDITVEATDLDGNPVVEKRREVAPGMGICMRGFYGPDGKFILDSFFPYREPKLQTNNLETNIIPQTDRYGMYGVCDDVRLGVDLVYFVQDMMALLKTDQKNNADVFFGGTSLMGLADSGTILLPVAKTPEFVERAEKARKKKGEKMLAARNGDEKAYEDLSMEEMNLYSVITSRLSEESIYEIIDTSFMPVGVETDKYAVVGEITDAHKFLNRVTMKTVWVLTLVTESMQFEVTVNEKDLMGIPKKGRRFKGEIWLQGKVNA